MKIWPTFAVDVLCNLSHLVIKVFFYQLMHKWITLKTISKFTLNQFRQFSVQSHYNQAAIIRAC
jgi:hypothetical protein